MNVAMLAIVLAALAWVGYREIIRTDEKESEK